MKTFHTSTRMTRYVESVKIDGCFTKIFFFYILHLPLTTTNQTKKINFIILLCLTYFARYRILYRALSEINLGTFLFTGKSTLLHVIIGELDVDDGNCTINGSISYASQETWLFEGTVRSNIVFIEEYNQKRYKDVVRVCCLERDFKLMPNGDMTVVGERGISLSGGQKARINLARAVYKEADIYLLDDPLSAVDAHVGKHIFQECVQQFLKDKICILVTHQLQYLKDVDHLVLMYHGSIEGQGTYAEVQESSMESFLTMQSLDETGNEETKTKVSYNWNFISEIIIKFDVSIRTASAYFIINIVSKRGWPRRN